MLALTTQLKDSTQQVQNKLLELEYTNITLIDEDLFQYREIWAAAGHPKALFPITPEQLINLTKGKVVSIK